MWRPFLALPRYFGGKRRLCPLIFREIDLVVPRRRWPELTFADAFLGGGSASLFAKGQGFGTVVCNDLARRSTVVGEALIANSHTRLTREDVVGLYRPHPANRHYLEGNYVPDLFSVEQARFIDNGLAVAEATAHPAKRAMLLLVLTRIMMASRPMSQFQPHEGRKVFGGDIDAVSQNRVAAYIEGLRLVHLSSVLHQAEAVNDGILPGHGEVHQGDVLDFLDRVDGDVLYLDSPYAGTLAYEKAYRVLDDVLEGVERPSSRFSLANAMEAFGEMLVRARRFPLWVISFGNETVTGDELRDLVARHGRDVKALEVRYSHLPSLASEEKNERNRELLVVAGVKR